MGESGESKKPEEAINNPKNKDIIGNINMHEKEKIAILIF
tara:strand:+ start:359 stop:478 length:120 start_codon:yes stop_codon:yes gene_type:complete